MVTLELLRRRTIDQLNPLLKELGIDRQDLSFIPLDLTPPGEDRDGIEGLVNAGIISTDEAREVIGMDQAEIKKFDDDVLMRLLNAI